ncbi:DUF6491 family protein [Pseudomonas jinjuensis]|uniref:Lipoprotein n=1 Tax=Pseudomonas jinjuensis TaxID=198616 RepID=A0A1H0QTW7_9PSED|nr:DUF6491 family protein [Pseudomonas jinjuensis]SDP20754.1 hypothetical protein SAMN05216193_12529 [Pseudomonas jinjuensis]
MRKPRAFLLLMAIPLFTACSSSPPSDQLPLDQHLAKLGYRQGEAVQSIPYWNFDGWQYLDKSHITIGQGPGPVYLVEFSAPCNNLGNSNRISTSTTVGSLTKLDRIISVDFAGIPEPCLIGDLYKLERVPKAKSRPVHEGY